MNCAIDWARWANIGQAVEGAVALATLLAAAGFAIFGLPQKLKEFGSTKEREVKGHVALEAWEAVAAVAKVIHAIRRRVPGGETQLSLSSFVGPLRSTLEKELDRLHEVIIKATMFLDDRTLGALSTFHEASSDFCNKLGAVDYRHVYATLFEKDNMVFVTRGREELQALLEEHVRFGIGRRKS